VNEFAGIVAMQVESLLRSLNAQVEAKCRDVRRDAEADARTLISDSRRKSIQRVREAVAEERRRRAAALRQARNQARARESRHRHRLYSALLRDGEPLLREALAASWRNVGSRRAWCAMVLEEALAALPAEGWRIEHPEAWQQADRDRFEAAMRARGVTRAEFSASAECEAGIRIRCGPACIDGTPSGLLADMRRVEGELLAEWERLVGTAGENDD